MSAGNFYLEPMQSYHIDHIHKIECDSFAVPWSRDSFVKELENPHAIYIAAAAKNRDIIGFAGMWHVVNEGHITNIAVSPEYRGIGVGDALVSAMIQIAKDYKMIGITLEVRMGNEPAQKLYIKHGFVFEGIRKNYYTDTKEDAIVMWKRFDTNIEPEVVL